MENFELVQQLKLELIHEYEQYVWTVAGLTETSEDDAREAFHRAICRMLVGLRKRPPGNPIVAWRPYIIQAAVNELRMEARRRKRVVLFSELDPEQRRELLSKASPEPTPAEQAERNELAALAWNELQKLPEYEREVIARRCKGESYWDIAKVLSVKPSTAASYWSKGISLLRERLGFAA